MMNFKKTGFLMLSLLVLAAPMKIEASYEEATVGEAVVEKDFTDKNIFEEFEIVGGEEIDTIEIPEKYQAVLSLFEEMSTEELNVYIQEAEEEYSNLARGAVVPTNNVENAWLAAAEIADRAGYPCAAALVRYSVYGVTYTEGAVSGTLFCPKIMSTSLYSDYVSRIKQGLGVPRSWEFTRSIDSDLFFALHNVNITHSISGTGNFKAYYITITDTFDFAYDNDYDSLFVSLVNNWAWLCQQADVLTPIHVQLSFVE